MKYAKSIDEYFAKADLWKDELLRLRKILLTCPLEETIKWGAACYTHKGKNVVGLGAFKSYVGLWFFQGALLSDKQGVLVNAQEGKTRAMRQWRFGSKREIKAVQIKAYVMEAIKFQSDGKQIKPRRAKTMNMPQELGDALSANRKAKTAFAALTPGKQREYAEYVSEAKRETTRVSRTKKVIPMILTGKGLNDRYRGVGSS